MSPFLICAFLVLCVLLPSPKAFAEVRIVSPVQIFQFDLLHLADGVALEVPVLQPPVDVRALRPEVKGPADVWDEALSASEDHGEAEPHVPVPALEGQQE